MFISEKTPIDILYYHHNFLRVPSKEILNETFKNFHRDFKIKMKQPFSSTRALPSNQTVIRKRNTGQSNIIK